ncbi:MAG: 5-formyltetrahydrofolate cyclo-ligase [Pseudomonadota bacterium]|nr:5-formyltetrahydrofolate cyclo-ligase [Pseudomonadota bacterium]
MELARRFGALEAFASARRIAGYLAVDGEMDPAPLLERAWAMGRQVFLPVLAGNPRFHLLFAPYHPDSPMKPNRLGIPEPDVADDQLLAPQRLDLALTPLVAFDPSGSRLGMGGGFYDRTFAFRRQPGQPPRPRLLGLAYELQKVPLLERQPWDVPLDGIVTEAALYPGDSGLLPEYHDP